MSIYVLVLENTTQHGAIEVKTHKKKTDHDI